MYIRKSVMSGAVMVSGAALLMILAVLYCFTEVEIPGYVYIFGWIGSILAVVDIVGKIERLEDGENIK